MTWLVYVVNTKPDGSVYLKEPYKLSTEKDAMLLAKTLQSAGFTVKVSKNG